MEYALADTDRRRCQHSVSYQCEINTRKRQFLCLSYRYLCGRQICSTGMFFCHQRSKKSVPLYRRLNFPCEIAKSIPKTGVCSISCQRANLGVSVTILYDRLPQKEAAKRISLYGSCFA